MGETLLQFDLLDSLEQLACGAAQQRDPGPSQTHAAISFGQENRARPMKSMGFDIQRDDGCGVLVIPARGQRGTDIFRQSEWQIGQLDGGDGGIIDGDQLEE